MGKKSKAVRRIPQVAQHLNAAPLDREPSRLFVIGNTSLSRLAVVQLRRLLAKDDQSPVPGEHLRVLTPVRLIPVEPRPFKGLLLLRIGDLVRLPSKGRKLLLSPNR